MYKSLILDENKPADSTQELHHPSITATYHISSLTYSFPNIYLIIIHVHHQNHRFLTLQQHIN